MVVEKENVMKNLGQDREVTFRLKKRKKKEWTNINEYVKWNEKQNAAEYIRYDALVHRIERKCKSNIYFSSYV